MLANQLLPAWEEPPSEDLKYRIEAETFEVVLLGMLFTHFQEVLQSTLSEFVSIFTEEYQPIITN